MAGRILVLDDEENYAEMLRDLLAQHHFRVDMATRPERAIDQLEEIPYDLVISDYKMPVMDGADFLKRSRALYPNLPVILVSGLMNMPELVKVANMSVTLVLEKPLDTDHFLGQVERFAAPMSEAELEEDAREPAEGEGGVEGGRVFDYPRELQFFAAESAASRRFLQTLWEACDRHSALVLLHASGSETEAILRDFSRWKGFADEPVTTLEADAVRSGDAAGRFREIAESESGSGVVGVLQRESVSPEGLDELFDAVAAATRDVPGGGSLFPVVAAADDDGALGRAAREGALRSVPADGVASLPRLRDRLRDLAHYARRYARLYADRLEKSGCAAFRDEAVQFLLGYDWPGEYEELHATVRSAVGEASDDALAAADLAAALGEPEPAETPPGDRLHRFLRARQAVMLGRLLRDTGLSPKELASKVGLNAEAVENENDLYAADLIHPELAKL